MQPLTVLPEVLLLVTAAVDEVPQDEDVTAGWLAFAIFIGLILAVALLGYSLVRHLRKAQASEDAGLYDPSTRRPIGRPRQSAVTDEAPDGAPDGATNGAPNGEGGKPADQP